MKPSSQNFSVEWNATSMQLVLRFDVRLIPKAEEPPGEMLAESRFRLAGLKNEGVIEQFMMHEERLRLFWTRLRRRKSFPMSHIHFIIGAGYPRMQGLNLTREGEGRARRYFLTIAAPRFIVDKWHPQWIQTYIDRTLAEHGHNERIQRAQVYALWARHAFNGVEVRHEPLLFARPKPKATVSVEPFRVRSRAQRGWVEVEFVSSKAFDLSGEQQLELRKQLRKQTRKFALAPGGFGYYLPLTNYVVDCWRQPESDMRRFGFGLPETALGGISITDGLLPDDITPGLTRGMADIMTTVLRECLRLHVRPAFQPEALQKVLRHPLGLDSLESLMTVLRARGLVIPNEAGDDFVVAPKIKYVGCRVAGEYVNAFDVSAAYVGANALAEPRQYAGRGISEIFAVSETEIAGIIATMRALRKRILTQIQDTPADARDCVFQMNLQLFPLTRLRPEYQAPEAPDGFADATREKQDCLPTIMQELHRLESFRKDPKWLAAKMMLGYTPEMYDGALRGDKPLLAKDLSLPMAQIAAELLPATPVNRREYATILVACSRRQWSLFFEQLCLLQSVIRDRASGTKGKDQVFGFAAQMFEHTLG